LIWNNWERFNGEQDNPGDSTDYNIPLIAVKPEVNSEHSNHEPWKKKHLDDQYQFQSETHDQIGI
jgi:hypothetical protein